MACDFVWIHIAILVERYILDRIRTKHSPSTHRFRYATKYLIAHFGRNQIQVNSYRNHSKLIIFLEQNSLEKKNSIQTYPVSAILHFKYVIVIVGIFWIGHIITVVLVTWRSSHFCVLCFLIYASVSSDCLFFLFWILFPNRFATRPVDSITVCNARVFTVICMWLIARSD